VPEKGNYKAIFNSDSEYYGGSNFENKPLVQAEETPWSDRPYSIVINLPPLSGIVLQKVD